MTGDPRQPTTASRPGADVIPRHRAERSEKPGLTSQRREPSIFSDWLQCSPLTAVDGATASHCGRRSILPHAIA